MDEKTSLKWKWGLGGTEAREKLIYMFSMCMKMTVYLLKKYIGSQYFNYSLHLFSSDGINNLSS